ncbi:phage tail sheath subtilisin-like domain-containing protein [Bartonella sp. B1099]|uniref:phage tail sheath subtilisin-like domain-containing protein n=1 Tax=Bartonella sp. B1099 TaxID=2911422 RepID=UPI003531DBE9
MFSQTAIGAVVTAPDADAQTYPLNEPVLVFTHETEKIQKLGKKGTALDVINAVRAQGIEAQVIFVRVEEKSTMAETQTEMVGSSVSLTGVHALAHARGHLGVEPGILLAPAYSAGRLDNAKNPLADALEQVAEKLQAIAVFDTGGKNTEESLAFRADFSSRFCYLIDPFVRVANSEGGFSIKPASPFVAAMFIKRDKQKGGVFWSPSNQDVKGILGTARPISYFDGEIDHEANRLNQADIATFIPARLSQNAQGQLAANGRILWGNHTTSSDPLWRFVNVVRTDQSAIDFLTRLADRMQARFLIKDNKFLFLSGDNLPLQTIHQQECSHWEFSLEPRTQYGMIEARYFDRTKGQQHVVTHRTGYTGPIRRLRMCYPCKQQALAAAASESDRLCRAMGSGSLSLEGRPEIMAGQPLLLQGFRDEINGPWHAATVTHRYEKQSGYITEITLEALNQG